MALSSLHFLIILKYSLLFNPPLSVHSIHFSFPTFDSNTQGGLEYQGDASPQNGLIQLTSNRVDQSIGYSMGRVTYTQRLHLWDPITRELADFTTHFSFIIKHVYSSYNGTNEYKSGDGIAFFLSPNSTQPLNSTGGYLGLINQSSVFNSSTNPFVAVEFDTFQNDWDSNANQVGIDINSMKSVAVVNWTGNLDNDEVATARVTYNGTTKNLSVYLTYDKIPVFPKEPTVSHSVDLSEYLPPYVTVGFSASTGFSIELHQLLSWEFDSTTLREISPSPSPVPSQLPPPFVVNGSPPTEIKSRGPSLKVIGPIIGGAAVVLGLLCFLWWKRITNTRETSKGQVMERNEMLQVTEGAAIDNDIELDQLDRAFSYGELVIATDNFGEHQKLGRGGFGEVYRGVLEDPPLEVAVKRLFNPSALQGKKQYASEVKTISQLRHRNVVHLIGWCHDQGHLLLVYELVPNGSLDSYLFGERGPLSWVVRYKITRGLASALLYLHEEGKRCVLHRDVKTSNVMLDSGFNAMLGDFGMARLIDHDKTLQTTDFGGTRGYLAPELYSTGKASKQSDVFSFGVVALEIACGRKVIDLTAEVGKVELVNWVWDLYGAGKILEAADQRLKMEFDLGEMERLMVVGLWCAHPDHSCRPSMRQVIAILNSEEAPLPNLPQKMPVAIYVVPPSVYHEVIENDGSALPSEGCSSDSSKLLASSSNSNTISALSHKSGP